MATASSPIDIPYSSAGSSWSTSTPSIVDASDELSTIWYSSLESSPVQSPVLSYFDTLSCSPHRARSPCIYEDSEHLPRLEQDFMTDFFCCGCHLADFHELLAHYETIHVLSGDRSRGKHTLCSAAPTVQPASNSLDMCSVASAFDTVVVPPQRTSPFYWDGTLSQPHQPSPPCEQLYVSSDDGDSDEQVDWDMDALDHIPEGQTPACLSPMLLSSQHRLCDEEATANPKAKTSMLLQADSALDVAALVSSSDAPVGRKARSASHAAARRQKAPKAFKCPHVGCTKSYAQANGLKYHLSKGTCDFGVTHAL